jgi:hypothetical protein
MPRKRKELPRWSHFIDSILLEMLGAGMRVGVGMGGVAKSGRPHGTVLFQKHLEGHLTKTSQTFLR